MKNYKNALKEARKIEKEKLLDKKKLLKVYKDGINIAKKIGRLLKPSWFVKETHKKTFLKKKSFIKRNQG